MATQPYRIERWADDASDTLNGAVLASDTTITLNSVAEFPTSGDFRVLIGTGGSSEYATVKSVSGSVFTLTAGLGSGYSSGTAVKLCLHDDGLDAAIAQAWGQTDYPYNRILNEGATATASSFTWFNQGTATCIDADDGGLIFRPPAEANTQLRGKYLTAPGTPWTATAYVEMGPGVEAWSSPDGTGAGLFARESSSGEIYWLFLRSDVLSFWRMTNATTFSADVNSIFLINNRWGVWMQIEDDGVDIKGLLSVDGENWWEVWSESRTAFMAGGPDQIGFGVSSGNASSDAEVYFKTWILE